MAKNLSKIFTGSGIICLSIAGSFFIQKISPGKLIFSNYQQTQAYSSDAGTAPQYLLIPALNINLSVYPTQIKDGNWPSTYNGVSFLSTSTIPGRVGNSIFYGHNWASLLGNLTQAKPGMEIEVIMDSGTKETYKIAYVQEVSANDSSILNQTEDKRLTLYTCSGFLDQKRLVVTAIEI